MKLTVITFMVSVLLIALATPHIIERIQSRDPGPSLSQYTPPVSSSQTRQTFYKWQDTSGQWYFGEDVPDGVEATAVNIDTAANILPPIHTTKQESTASQSLNAESTTSGSSLVRPWQALDLVDQAKQVKSMLESRSASADET